MKTTLVKLTIFHKTYKTFNINYLITIADYLSSNLITESLLRSHRFH